MRITLLVYLKTITNSEILLKDLFQISGLLMDERENESNVNRFVDGAVGYKMNSTIRRIFYVLHENSLKNKCLRMLDVMILLIFVS